MPRRPFHHRLLAPIVAFFGWLGDVWNALIRPVEGFFARLGEMLFDAFDSFNGLESAVVRTVGFLLWPILAPIRWIARRLPERSPGAGPGVFTRLWVGLLTFAEKLNLDKVILAIAWVLTPIWWPIASLLGFVNAWLFTRSTRELALAVPALLLAAPFAYVAITWSQQSHGEIAKHYQQVTKTALAEGDYKLARLLERKLAQLGVDTRRTEYRAAESLAEDGDLVAAYARMSNLATLDEPGYPQAHGWIIERLLNGELTEEHDERLASEGAGLELAEKHLKQLGALEIEGRGVDLMWAVVYQATDRVDEACQVLEPYRDTDLPLAAARLQMLADAKRLADARLQAEGVLRLAEREGEAAQIAELMPRLALAAELLGNEQRLESVVLDWIKLAPEDPTPKGVLTRLRTRQVEQLLNLSTPNPRGLVNRLVEAAEAGLPREWLLKKVRAIALRGDRLTSFQAAWERLVAMEDGPADLLVPVATQAASNGQIVEARRLFAGLIERGVNEPMVLNNYAWTLQQEPEADLPGALQAAGRAVDAAPNDHRYRETRGQVLAQMERWEEALADLEYALNRMPDSVAIHATLARIYDALDKPKLAQVHRRRAGS